MYVTSPDAARAEIKQGFERRILELLGNRGADDHV
jgi:hypothetical protein